MTKLVLAVVATFALGALHRCDLPRKEPPPVATVGRHPSEAAGQISVRSIQSPRD